MIPSISSRGPAVSFLNKQRVDVTALSALVHDFCTPSPTRRKAASKVAVYRSRSTLYTKFRSHENTLEYQMAARRALVKAERGCLPWNFPQARRFCADGWCTFPKERPIFWPISSEKIARDLIAYGCHSERVDGFLCYKFFGLDFGRQHFLKFSEKY